MRIPVALAALKVLPPSPAEAAVEIKSGSSVGGVEDAAEPTLAGIHLDIANERQVGRFNRCIDPSPLSPEA